MRKPLTILNEYTDSPEQATATSCPASDLDIPVEHLVGDITKRPHVPNVQPRIRHTNRLAIIGEAPGADEVIQRTPFVGMAGRFLSALLGKNGILRDAALVANVCQHRPPNNDIDKFDRNGPEMVYGMERLAEDLETFRPNVCLLLGKTALFAAKGVEDIGNWRGSLFLGERGPFLGRKCIASYHPAACLRQYSWTPVLNFDIQKAWRQAGSPELVLPQRDLILPEPGYPSFANVQAIRQRLQDIKSRKPLIAIDIEGYVDAMSCISIAESPEKSFIVPFTTLDNQTLFDLDEELGLWRDLADVLADPAIPKVLQNSLYDRFVLQYSYDIVVRGVVDDTMLKHWERFCELEKSLAFQASIYTNEPYYKHERKVPDLRTHWQYGCKDSAVTHEINTYLNRLLPEPQRNHYLFNMILLNPLLYMENRGIRYDSAKAADRLREVNAHVYRLQSTLDSLAGYGVDRESTRAQLLANAQSIMCMKRDPSTPKKEFREDYARLYTTLRDPSAVLDDAFFGWYNTSCKLSLNIKSKEFKTYLYDTLRLPVQYDPKTGSPTTDYEALLTVYKKTDNEIVRLALEISSLRTRSQMLAIHADPDGRIRCGYNAVGTETGRLTCYTSPTGSGYNLQTIPDADKLKPEGHPLRAGMRDLFLADPGFLLFQCDLAGADGWTVAAHLAHLGDSTMLDDYKAGIKPAKVLCYLLRHGASSLFGKTRPEIKALTNSVQKDSWDYFACKIGQHGTCYLMGPRKLATQIFIQSEGRVNLSEKETRDLQNLFMVRYRVKIWHDATGRALMKRAEIVSASGHVRRFFGRREEILGQALAHEPQANTTYATNLAAVKLWTDPDNKGPNGLRIEPLHQVHDALLGQFRVEDTAWAVGKIREYFDNTLIIAHQPIKIPFEGNYGPSWGQLNVGTI